MTNRLTERDEFGNADIIGVDSPDLQLHLDFGEINLVTDALNKLAAYEDSGLSPERVAELAAAEREGECEFCANYNFSIAMPVIKQYGNWVHAYISLAGGNARFAPKDRFQYCPCCGAKIKENKNDD